ncbi:hypothetical protein KV557_24820 [Kitasatospora aureofaciens]|uniref:hypothetical protein n=1 Tax=Kitasatospora aureofaciens TaxID=1894 RepID=UPI001C45B294|nr:hypothetical protein [Kitasatospora aureofaciens]MBV6700289.1 hypothetical protein [Kitasatospora aureofaciens]
MPPPDTAEPPPSHRRLTGALAVRRSSDDQLRRRVLADIASGFLAQPACLDWGDLLARYFPADAPRGAWHRQPDDTEVFLEGVERALRLATSLRRLEAGRWLRQYRGLS